MLNIIKQLEVYQNLHLENNSSHAYLFYSHDTELNKKVALAFSRSLLCEKGTNCGKCNACIQFEKSSHPDLFKLESDSIKVEDVNKILANLSTMPISAERKVFVILSSENINETAQNKLLKSLEEPSSKNVFVLACNKIDKLLPTVLSRLKKFYVGKLNNNDKLKLATELKKQNIDIFKYLNKDITLSEMLNFETDENYINTLSYIKKIFLEMKTSSDIPNIANQNVRFDKNLFLPLLQGVLLDSLNKDYVYDKELTEFIRENYSKKALLKCLKLVDKTHKMQLANVNFSYLLDNLLFNILKEKFLCK